MSGAMSGGLRLRACDGDDLKVISAMMQDSIIPICDVAFLAEERLFVLIANRFRWERGEGRGRPAAGPNPDQPSPYERTNTALRFRGVDKVSTRGIDLHDRTLMLSLLAIEQGPDGVLLHFAGGGSIRLAAGARDCCLEDLGEPWPTGLRPCHEGLDEIAAE